MKPVYQTKTGTEGNCLEACTASILEVPIDDERNKLPLVELRLNTEKAVITLNTASFRHVGITEPFYVVVGVVNPTGGHHAVVGVIHLGFVETGFNIYVVHDPAGAVQENYKIMAILLPLSIHLLDAE